MSKSSYKRLNTRSHFPDFWHKAKSWRINKKIGARNERRKLNRKGVDNDGNDSTEEG